ncbi:MAG: ABC transporter ATP-binding protein [Elusimicrobia bacterium]|nr:ABC transporter ATP-binding protein [Elusimicrobiota bacterium]
MSSSVLEARGLYKTYGEGPQAVSVLKGLDFSVLAGEYLMILGPSGSGKSTLLNILGLMDRPDAGELFLTGIPLSKLGETERALLRNESVGFVFQFDSLLPEFTVLENVTMPARIGLRRRAAPPGAGPGDGVLAEATERAHDLLEGLGIAGLSRRFPSELSGGERQRVAICRALLMRPAMILADEPTGNLDKANGEKVFSDLRNLAEREGAAVVVVTHNEGACHHANRVLHMLDGAIVQGMNP